MHLFARVIHGESPLALNVSGFSYGETRPHRSMRLVVSAPQRPPRRRGAEGARQQGVRPSRLAHGVPLGGELEYVDRGTLAHAFGGRSEMT